MTVKSDKPSPLGKYLRARREELGLGLREVARLTERKVKACGIRVSSPYLSQVESGWADPEKVSMDVLWALGVVLGVEPSVLWVMAREGIDRRYFQAAERKKIFRVDSFDG